MKKLLLLSLIAMSAIVVRGQTISLDFTVGILTGANGITPIPDGSLIQVIAAPTVGDFVAPTPTSFVSGSAFVLWSEPFNSSVTGTPGAMDVINTAISPTALPQGYALMIQWFPTLTTASSVPGYGTPYGQYMGQFATNGLDGNGNPDPAWTAPAAGATVVYQFITTSGGGVIGDPIGAALQATAAAVPEPATYAMIFGLVAMIGVAFRRRQLA